MADETTITPTGVSQSRSATVTGTENAVVTLTPDGRVRLAVTRFSGGQYLDVPSTITLSREAAAHLGRLLIEPPVAPADQKSLAAGLG